MSGTPAGEVTGRAGLAIVVGGGSGIGAAVAAAHRAAGTPVVVWDIAGERDVTCDVADPASVDAAMAETLAAAGLPRTVTVAAGIGAAGLLREVGPEEWDRVLGVNAKGAWLVLRAAANALVDAGASGSLVAVTSVNGRLVDRGTGLYCASKAALDMLVKVAAAEWAEHRIRVNAVAPGVTRTPILGPSKPGTGWLADVEARTPLGRLGEADEVAAAIVALHGLGWVTGEVLTVDGGLSLQSPIDSYGWVRRHLQARG